MKRCSVSLAIENMQLKTTVRGIGTRIDTWISGPE